MVARHRRRCRGQRKKRMQMRTLAGIATSISLREASTFCTNLCFGRRLHFRDLEWHLAEGF